MPNKRAEGRITPNIAADEALWAAAKKKAAAEGTNMSAVIGALLRRWLDGEIALGAPIQAASPDSSSSKSNSVGVAASSAADFT